MRNIISFFRSKPVFVFLLPVYFVFHGFTENYNAVPLKDALWLLLTYLLFTLIFFLAGWLFYRRLFKAAFFSFCVMGFNFFFGSIKFFLKNSFNDAFISSYKFLLPISLLAFIALTWFLKRRKEPMVRLCLFINVLLCILAITDAGWLIQKGIQRHSSIKTETEYTFRCDTCSKPDIYFLIFDEYSSSAALKETWNYDNSQFDSFLMKKGFRLFPRSRSNYNFTEFSIASTLNMDFLKIENPLACTVKDYNICFERINNNHVCSILSSMGYDIVNHSIFDLQKISSPVKELFLPLKTKLITSQTFINSMQNDFLPYLLVGRFQIKWLSKYCMYFTHNNNQKIIAATLNDSAMNSARPKFVYSHIEMPHYPFYFDKNGRLKTTDDVITRTDIVPYLDYLPKTNHVIERIITNILNRKKPCAIVLMGDHGFREKQTDDFQFRNLNAVYLSSGNYSGFYDSMTNVNEFRVLLNNLFHANFSLKKDSTILLHDK